MYSPFPRPTHTSPDDNSSRRELALCCSKLVHSCCGEMVIRVLSQSSRSEAAVERTARPSSMDLCMFLSRGSTTLATAVGMTKGERRQAVVRRHPTPRMLAQQGSSNVAAAKARAQTISQQTLLWVPSQGLRCGAKFRLRVSMALSHARL